MPEPLSQLQNRHQTGGVTAALFIGIVFLAAVVPLRATTFVVPPDRDMVHRADTIVIATALTSYSRYNGDGGVETVTPMSVEETIKGLDVPATIDVVEPGGAIDGIITAIAGVPRFREGRRMLLMLSRTGSDRWAVTELVLGKFSFDVDTGGRNVLVRDEDEIVGWDPNLDVHREHRRLADPFLRFVRTEARGGMGKADYFTNALPLTTQSTSTTLTPGTNIAPYSATSYTMVVSGAMGSRWNVFPNAVSIFRGVSGEPGAPNNGDTAIGAAIAAWDNDCLSNVNYVYAGIDNGSHTQGLHAPDGANTILFEQDLSAWGVAPFSCSANGYSGTLGLGGVTSASGSNVVNGETFATTNEADVMMNQGLANCSLLFSNGDFNSAVTHEVGHTLGFRHSDQNRSNNAACSTDPSLECSSSAIMTAFVTHGVNGALQAWDQHAVDAIYPGNVCAPGASCTAPAITANPTGTSISAGGSVTLTVTATGTPLTYQWYQGASGDTSKPIPNSNSPSITVSPGTTASFWVQVSNACGSANSAAATITVSLTNAAATTATKLYLVTCRLIDTRNTVILAPGSVRTVTATGSCGIPAGTNSIAINLTAVSPASSGFLTAYPGTGGGPPGTSTVNYTPARSALANNAVVRLSTDGKISVYNSGPGAAHFIIDVTGYFK